MCLLLSTMVLIKLVPLVRKYLCGTKRFYSQAANELLMGFMSGCNQRHRRQPSVHCRQESGFSPTERKDFLLIGLSLLVQRKAGVCVDMCRWNHRIREALLTYGLRSGAIVNA